MTGGVTFTLGGLRQATGRPVELDRLLPSHRPIGDLVAELNPVLRGWGNYFRWGNSARKFSQVDEYVRKRLALFDSKKRQQRGRRWGATHTNAWATGLGVHRLSGTVRYLPSATVRT